jgi:hypothetical protein
MHGVGRHPRGSLSNATPTADVPTIATPQKPPFAVASKSHRGKQVITLPASTRPGGSSSPERFAQAGGCRS